MDKELIINELIKHYSDGKKADFAKKLGITPQTISAWLARNTFDIELIFTKCEDIDANWLLTGDGDMLRRKESVKSSHGVPLIPIEAVAGLPSADEIGVKFADCERYVIPEFADKGVDYMIRVHGSSMYPKYSNGDILACKFIKDVLFFQWGKIYVIDSSQGALVKRVFEDKDNPGNLILVSDNKDNYPPFSFPKADIRSLSIVIGVVRLE